MLSVYTRAAFIHLQTCKAGLHQHQFTNNLRHVAMPAKGLVGLINFETCLPILILVQTLCFTIIVTEIKY